MTRIGSGFSLDKANGKLMGVCAGLAEWTGLDALWVRVGVVALTVLGSFITIPLYLIVGFLAPVRTPVIGWDSYDDSRELARWRRRRAGAFKVDGGRIDPGLAELDQRVSEMERSLRSDSFRA